MLAVYSLGGLSANACHCMALCKALTTENLYRLLRQCENLGIQASRGLQRTRLPVNLLHVTPSIPYMEASTMEHMGGGGGGGGHCDTCLQQGQRGHCHRTSMMTKKSSTNIMACGS